MANVSATSKLAKLFVLFQQIHQVHYLDQCSATFFTHGTLNNFPNLAAHLDH